MSLGPAATKMRIRPYIQNWTGYRAVFAVAGAQFGALNDDGLYVFRELENHWCYMVFRTEDNKIIEKRFQETPTGFAYNSEDYPKTQAGIYRLVRRMSGHE